jgi:hypothetical protein
MTENTSQAGSQTARQVFEQDVIARARTDAAFRADLLADPRQTVRRVYGIELPASIELRVVEETPSVFYLVLPAASEELSDEQLASVSGGVGMGGMASAACGLESAVAAAGTLACGASFAAGQGFTRG